MHWAFGIYIYNIHTDIYLLFPKFIHKAMCFPSKQTHLKTPDFICSPPFGGQHNSSANLVALSHIHPYSRWWFETFFVFLPRSERGDAPSWDLLCFQMSWFNHHRLILHIGPSTQPTGPFDHLANPRTWSNTLGDRAWGSQSWENLDPKVSNVQRPLSWHYMKSWIGS